MYSFPGLQEYQYPRLPPRGPSSVAAGQAGVYNSNHKYFLGMVLFRHLNHAKAPTQQVWNAMKL